MQRRELGSCSNLLAQSPPPRSDDNITRQKASQSVVSSRKLGKKTPNIDLEDIDPAPSAMKVNESSTEASEMRFRIPKASTGVTANQHPSQLDVSNLRGKKWQAFAKQTMQDVISPKAFEQWTKDQTIPKMPNDFWSASDMRKAYTFKKRQWKLSKPEYQSLKLDTGPSIASHQQPRRKDASTHRAKQNQSLNKQERKQRKQRKSNAEP